MREAAAVSVVVPVYNATCHLRAAIESIFAQRSAPCEIIVVDDGSTDETPRIIAGFGAAIVALRQENGGPAAARNTGIARAKAPLIAFLDADDLWLPTTLDDQLACLAREPDACGTWGRSERRVEPGTPAPSEDWHGLPQWSPVMSSKLFRRDVLARLGGLDCSLRDGGEDLDLMVRLAEAGLRPAQHAGVVHVFRLHGENLFSLDDAAIKRANFEVVRRAFSRRRAEAA